MRILVVEDDPEIAEGLRVALQRAGYVIDVAHDGLEGEEMALLHPYGVILLDWMLPGKDGAAVCKTLRHEGVRTPILMVTARDAVSHRVHGLDVGADDYLVKPFALEELLARIRALARRESERRAAVHHVGDLVVDSVAQTVTKSGNPIHLTKREFQLLEALAKNPGRVLTRDAIVERVWNAEEVLPNTVSFHMASLRKKVDPEGLLIHTVHGIGYTLSTDAGARRS